MNLDRVEILWQRITTTNSDHATTTPQATSEQRPSVNNGRISPGTMAVEISYLKYFILINKSNLLEKLKFLYIGSFFCTSSFMTKLKSWLPFAILICCCQQVKYQSCFKCLFVVAKVHFKCLFLVSSVIKNKVTNNYHSSNLHLQSINSLPIYCNISLLCYVTLLLYGDVILNIPTGCFTYQCYK